MKKIILSLTALSFVSIGSIAYSSTRDNAAVLKQKPKMICICSPAKGCKCTALGKAEDGSIIY